MKNMYKILSILIISISYFSISKAQEIPSSFADLAEKLMHMLKKLDAVADKQLRAGGLVFAIIGFIIIWYSKS